MRLISTCILLLLFFSQTAMAKNPRVRGIWTSIPDRVWQDMQGKSWHQHLRCPARNTLAYLRIPYMDYDGNPQTGEMIVAKDVADSVLDVFDRLQANGFRFARIRLVHHYEGNDDKSMAANNTSAFNCRTTSSGKRLSEHAYGRAIDINPVQNPYVTRRGTYPRAGHPYNTASKRHKSRHPGIIKQNNFVVKTFRQAGWKWGGHWRYSKDYQHFSQSGK